MAKIAHELKYTTFELSYLRTSEAEMEIASLHSEGQTFAEKQDIKNKTQ